MKTTKQKQTPDRDLAALTVQKYQMLWPNIKPKIGLDYETTVDMMIEFAKVYAAQSFPSREDFPDIDFRKDMAEEMSRDQLINGWVEMKEVYESMRKEWFQTLRHP